jgi:hypothetical protein
MPAWDAFWASWNHPAPPAPLLGSWRGFNGFIALLLGPLPAGPLDRQCFGSSFVCCVTVVTAE